MSCQNEGVGPRRKEKCPTCNSLIRNLLGRSIRGSHLEVGKKNSPAPQKGRGGSNLKKRTQVPPKDSPTPKNFSKPERHSEKKPRRQGRVPEGQKGRKQVRPPLLQGPIRDFQNRNARKPEHTLLGRPRRKIRRVDFGKLKFLRALH